MKRVAILLVALALGGCDAPSPSRGGAVVPAKPDLSLVADLAIARKSRIFFSHHSVGENIIDGMQAVASDVGAAPLAVAPLQQGASHEGPAFLHASGGRNGDPASKIAFFEATMRGRPELKPDLAFMKFCFVDVVPTTDVDALFAQYERTMASLKREFPRVRFAHVTFPLVPRPMDVKSRMRRLLGLWEWTDASNAKRHEFNEKLRRKFAGDPIFDLARVESTLPDGTVVAFELDGKLIPSMADAYGDSHLNMTGKRVAGAAAIQFLAAALGPTAAAQ